jgi:hypothetical protein
MLNTIHVHSNKHLLCDFDTCELDIKLRILLNHIINTCIDLFSVIGGHLN